MCGVDNYSIFSSLMKKVNGDLTEVYRIVIAYTEIEIHIVKQEHIFFPAISPILSDWVT